MSNTFKLMLYGVILLMVMTTFSRNNYESEGQLAIPNITQREQPELSADLVDSIKSPQPDEELIAMQGIFSQSGKIIGFGLNVNNGSQLCPPNNCEFTIENGMLNHDFDGYSLEGKLNVTERGVKNSTWYEIEANLKEPWNKQSDQESNKKFMTGFLFTSSVEGNKSPHYYIYNGTLVINPDNSTLILQGRDY